MKKWVKIAVPIACVAVVGVTYYMIFDMKNKIEENDFSTEDIIEQNTIEQNSIIEDNSNFENQTKNENVSNNTVSNENNNKVEDPAVSSGDADKYSENNQAKAVELVQKEWGEDSSVYFTNEGINSNDEYTVAVRDKSTTAVKTYYKVNLKTKKVTVDY